MVIISSKNNKDRTILILRDIRNDRNNKGSWPGFKGLRVPSWLTRGW